MDFTQITDDELRAELEGMQLALGATLGRPFDGHEERNKADLLLKIEAAKTELERRNADKT